LAAGNTNPQVIADPPPPAAQSVDAVFGSEEATPDPADYQAPAHVPSEIHDRALMALWAELDLGQSRGKQRKLPWNVLTDEGA
jgi:hypothetical protein